MAWVNLYTESEKNPVAADYIERNNLHDFAAANIGKCRIAIESDNKRLGFKTNDGTYKSCANTDDLGVQANIPTADQKAALAANAGLTAGNPAATIQDIVDAVSGLANAPKRINYGAVITQEAQTPGYIIADPSGGTLDLLGFFAACELAKGLTPAVGDFVQSPADSTDGFFAALKAPYTFCNDDVWEIYDDGGSFNVRYVGQTFPYFMSVLSLDNKKRGLVYGINNTGVNTVEYDDTVVTINHCPAQFGVYNYSLLTLIADITDPAGPYGDLPFLIGGNYDGCEVPIAAGSSSFGNLICKSSHDIYWYDTIPKEYRGQQDNIPANADRCLGLIRWKVGVSDLVDTQLSIARVTVSGNPEWRPFF